MEQGMEIKGFIDRDNIKHPLKDPSIPQLLQTKVDKVAAVLAGDLAQISANGGIESGGPKSQFATANHTHIIEAGSFTDPNLDIDTSGVYAVHIYIPSTRTDVSGILIVSQDDSIQGDTQVLVFVDNDSALTYYRREKTLDEQDWTEWESFEYAPKSHNHDTLYAPIAHNHNTVYSPIGGSYSINVTTLGTTTFEADNSLDFLTAPGVYNVIVNEIRAEHIIAQYAAQLYVSMVDPGDGTHSESYEQKLIIPSGLINEKCYIAKRRSYTDFDGSAWEVEIIS